MTTPSLKPERGSTTPSDQDVLYTLVPNSLATIIAKLQKESVKNKETTWHNRSDRSLCNLFFFPDFDLEPSNTGFDIFDVFDDPINDKTCPIMPKLGPGDIDDKDEKVENQISIEINLNNDDKEIKELDILPQERWVSFYQKVRNFFSPEFYEAYVLGRAPLELIADISEGYDVPDEKIFTTTTATNLAFTIFCYMALIFAKKLKEKRPDLSASKALYYGSILLSMLSEMLPFANWLYIAVCRGEAAFVGDGDISGSEGRFLSALAFGVTIIGSLAQCITPRLLSSTSHAKDISLSVRQGLNFASLAVIIGDFIETEPRNLFLIAMLAALFACLASFIYLKKQRSSLTAEEMFENKLEEAREKFALLGDKLEAITTVLSSAGMTKESILLFLEKKKIAPLACAIATPSILTITDVMRQCSNSSQQKSECVLAQPLLLQ